MSTQAQATFAIQRWEEAAYLEMEHGGKCTRASISYAFQGDIAGESTLEYVMYYREAGSGSFVGIEHIVGSVGGRKGSFVLQHHGTFEGSSVKTNVSVVPNSGTDELQGLYGSGVIDITGHQEQYPITLEYGFD